MSEIVIHLRDKSKIDFLVELLNSFDFVDGVDTTIDTESVAVDSNSSDFFSLAGLWSGRDIDVETIRRQAWSRQQR